MGGNILITGSTGFVGSALIRRLVCDAKYQVRAVTRQSVDEHFPGVEQIQIGNIAPDTDWRKALIGTSVVIHTAARVHVIRDQAIDPLSEYRLVNTEGTLNLARQAAELGVERFIYLSSIKVNGEETRPGEYFTAEDKPAAIDPYGISKSEAESGLFQIADATGMEVVVIRPVLVYGPGVKGNFLTMMDWLSKGIPLPFGAIHNKRSLVALDNLVDLMVTCITHPRAENQVFLVSDGDDLSTTELLERTSIALAKNARLLPVPQKLLELGFNLLGKQELARRLCGSLQVNISKTRNILDWNPPLTIDEGLHGTVQWYKEYTNKRDCT